MKKLENVIFIYRGGLESWVGGVCDQDFNKYWPNYSKSKGINIKLVNHKIITITCGCKNQQLLFVHIACLYRAMQVQQSPNLMPNKCKCSSQFSDGFVTLNIYIIYQLSINE